MDPLMHALASEIALMRKLQAAAVSARQHAVALSYSLDIADLQSALECLERREREALAYA